MRIIQKHLELYGNTVVNNNGNIVDFAEDDLTDSFNFKAKITAQAGDNGRKYIEIMDPLKYFFKEMPVINCENNFILTWSLNCVMISTNNINQTATFTITETKLYVPEVTLSTQDNSKLLQELN